MSKPVSNYSQWIVVLCYVMGTYVIGADKLPHAMFKLVSCTCQWNKIKQTRLYNHLNEYNQMYKTMSSPAVKSTILKANLKQDSVYCWKQYTHKPGTFVLACESFIIKTLFAISQNNPFKIHWFS